MKTVLGRVSDKKIWWLISALILLTVGGVVSLPLSASLLFPYPNATLQLCTEFGRLVYKNVNDGSSSFNIKTCLKTADNASNFIDWCISQGWEPAYARDYTRCHGVQYAAKLGASTLVLRQSASFVHYPDETEIFLWTTLLIKPLE